MVGWVPVGGLGFVDVGGVPVGGVGFVDVSLWELHDLLGGASLVVRVGVDPVQLRGQAVLGFSRAG